MPFGFDAWCLLLKLVRTEFVFPLLERIIACVQTSGPTVVTRQTCFAQPRSSDMEYETR